MLFVMMSVAQTVKIKVKIHPRSGHAIPEGDEKYSSTLCLTSTLDGSGWLLCPGCFTPFPQKETWYPLCGRLGGPQGWSGWLWKISPHSRIHSSDHSVCRALLVNNSWKECGRKQSLPN